MILLAVESSCDETAVALVQDGRTVLADCIASSVEMHKIYGGVVPEIASRKHIEVISQLADQALVKAGLTRKDIDAVAVTYAPGLIGAVLVGVSFAKSVAYALGVPLIPVHHVRGHIAANYIAHPDLEPPFVCLCVSGGTSLIVDVRGYTDRSWARHETTQPVSASTRSLGSWAWAIPAALPWIGPPRPATTRPSSCRASTSRTPRWICPFPA